MSSIGLAFNCYAEPNMLPSFLEHASRVFDDIFAINAVPSGAPPDDATTDILSRWGVRWKKAHIDDGFGHIRTRLIHESTTEWVCILDCDERIFATLPVLECVGTGKYPEDPVPNLSVGVLEPCFNQRDLLRGMLDRAPEEIDALRTVRRHWMDFGMHRPAQDWTKDADWQLRIVRNRPFLGYASEIRMHEQFRNSKTGEPKFLTADTRYGPYHDHFHVPAKRLEPSQRQEDIAIYDAIHFGTQKETWEKLYGQCSS